MDDLEREMMRDIDAMERDWRAKESLWWCIKRQVRVVGGWHRAILCPDLVLDSARDLQRDMREWHDQSLAQMRRMVTSLASVRRAA